jgi:hypothetical protein
MCTDSLLEHLTASLLRKLQEQHPDYEIGRLIVGLHERWYAYRRRGNGPHTIITDDLAEIAEHLGAH